MADEIMVRATVALPADPGGRSVAAGDEFLVDRKHPTVASHLRVGFLIPLEPLPMPDELRPAKARTPKRK